MAEAVAAGKLIIPIDRKMPLANASEAHVAVGRGGSGKLLLLP